MLCTTFFIMDYAVVEQYVQNYGGSLLDGLRKFYNSSTNYKFVKDKTMLWNLGSVGLYENFVEKG